MVGCGGVGIATAGIPSISAILPQTIAAGSGNTTMEVVGANVDGSTIVLWNGSPLSTTLVSDSTVSSPVESASIATPATVQVQLMNSTTGSKSSPFALSIASATKASPLSITTASLPNGTVGTSYSASLTATGGTPSYTWQLTSGKVPAGLTMTATGSISGTPTTAGTYSLGLTVMDKSRPVQAKFIALTVIIAPKTVTVTPVSISTTSLHAASFGAAYSQTLQASGGSGTYTWSIASGSLPGGLTLSAAGVVSGTPAASGSFPFTVSVSDTSSPVQTKTAPLGITVSPSPIRIATTSLAGGTEGNAYSQTLSVSGGTPGYSWSLASGSLPAGLTLSAAGVISGTPSAAGTASFVAAVHDSGNPSQTASVSLSISIAAPALNIASSSLVQGTFGRPYSATLQATGGTPGYSWSVASGSLPAGLALNNATGVISGTALAGGTASFTAAVRDSSSPAQAASSPMTIIISAAPLAITASTLASVTVGGSYAQTLQATGGTAPYHWSITSGQLPAGLRLSSSGAISGTASAAGTATFTATATDSSNPTQTASLVMSILVNPAQSTLASVTPLSLLAPAAASGTVGTAFTQTLGVTGGTSPYTWSIKSGSMPAGLTLGAGTISGTPAAGSSGSYSVTVAVTDSESTAQSASSTMSITIAAAPVPTTPLSIQSSTLASGTAGTAYNQSLQAAGGTAPYTWSLANGSLPAGLTLNPSGTISGTPTASGASTFSVTASDTSSPAQTRSASLSIAIAAAPAPTAGTTWFVRPDGGTRYSANVTTGQCNGQADVPYPGTGVNQNCAFNDVRYMWMDGTYGNSQWVMNGGDTLVIRGCAALPSQQNPDAPHCRIGWDKGTGNDSQNFWCAGVSAFWGCSMPPPPSGTAAQHTRILGGCAYDGNCSPVNTYPYTNNNLTQLFGGFDVGAVLWLNGSSYIDLAGLEITSHNGQCTRVGSPLYPKGCSTSVPVDDFAAWGIVTTNTTSNVTMTDLYVHGFTNLGIGGPIGGAFTLTRVFIGFNAFAGWNFDDGSSTPDAPGSTLTQSYVTMIGNGCLEQYPIANPQYPALACWDINDAGFGDAWSGQNSTLAGFSCDHCLIAYNTKDAAMGPHTLIHNLRMTNSLTVGNMGQQDKWGTDANSTTLFQNNLIVGNCMRMSQQLPGAAQNFNNSTGRPGSYLSDFCRASGDIFAFFSDANSSVSFLGNTIIATSPTIFDLGCNTANNCGSTPYVFKDNIFLGYTAPASYYPYNGEAPGLFYSSDATVSVASSYNVEYGVRNGDCPTGGTGIVCRDPMFVNEPAQGAWPPETVLDNFNFKPTAGSPAFQAGTALSGLINDYYGVVRPNPPSIGAIEP